jgi:hypothetical protein
MGSGGSFIAILLSVPLTAVALVGVVGVPKLQEMLSPASSQGDDEFDEDSFSSRPRTKRGASRSGREKEDDAALWSDESDFDEQFADDLGSKTKSARSKPSLARTSRTKPAEDSTQSDPSDDSDDFFSKPRSRFGQSQKEPEPTEMYATEPFKPRSQVQQAQHVEPAVPAARPDNFASALDRLRAMGVDSFHLEPGLAAGQYLFVCLVDGAGESATVHRFEAEAADPSAAVADVLKQLAEWQAESSMTRTAGAEIRR